MHFTTLAATTLLASAAASAIPRTSLVQLSKRDEREWDKNGNIKLTFSKETVNVGSLNIDDVFGQVAGICHESGQCETNDLEFKSQFLTSDSAYNLAITIGPDGEYPTWIRNGLVDVLHASVKAVAKCESGTYTNHCYGSSAMAYCPPNTHKYTNCEVPKYWGINYQAPDAANAAPPNIGLNVNVEKEGSSGVCEAAMTAMSGVAGAVNGAAGGVFTLLSLACQ